MKTDILFVCLFKKKKSLLDEENSKGKISEAGNSLVVQESKFQGIGMSMETMYVKNPKKCQKRSQHERSYKSKEGVALIPRKVGSQWRDLCWEVTVPYRDPMCIFKS